MNHPSTRQRPARRSRASSRLESLESRCVLAGEPLLISEFMAANVSTLTDRFREYSDWVEIYNPTDTEVSLEGWGLTDDATQPSLWTFPRVALGPHNALVVFASGRDRRTATAELHTNFKLGSEGDYLGLYRPDGTLAHAFAPEYPAQRGDVSYGVRFTPLGPSPDEHQYFGTPTPGTANELGRSTFAAAVTADVARGFFDAPFQVHLSSASPGSVIRYTIDGSAPTPENGLPYNGPLTISTTTTLRAIAFSDTLLPSQVMTNTYLFLSDVLRQTGAGLPTQWGYFDDQGPTRPARAQANYAMDPEVVNNPLYRNTLLDDLRSLPTLSLVLDPNDLWDLDTGLYTNPESRGDAWERPVSLEWIEPNGDTSFISNAGLQMHGGWARRISQTAKFSFRVSFKGQYGDPLLEYPLFGPDSPDAFDEIVLRGGFNDSWTGGDRNNTYMQDQWARATQRAMGGIAAKETYVHLYLNGLYWGMYSPTERPNAMWAAFYQGGDADEYDVINTGGNIVAGDSAAWNQLVRALSPSRYDYNTIRQLVDLPSFADYLIVNQYIGNWDWPHNNWYASRRRTDDGQWHFHSWDAEAAFQQGTGTDRVNTSITAAVGPSDLYLALRNEPEFQELFANRVAKHLFNDGVLTPAANQARLNGLAAKIDRAIVAESARWGDGRTDSVSPALTRDNAWIPRINSLNNQYFPRRGTTLLSQYRTGNLFPDLDPPSVTPAGGRFADATNVTVSSAVGDVYYTLNGRDPRNGDGTVSPDAIPLNLRTLVTPASAARAVASRDLPPPGWEQPAFDDSAWIAGQAAIGYDTGEVDDPLLVPDGFQVVQHVSNVSLDSLADVDRLLTGTNRSELRTVTGVPTINYHGQGRDAHFDDSLPFPISGNNFALDITGKLVVSSAGTYTFGVTSNDAARLLLDGRVLYEDTERHNATDTFVTVELAAGTYDLQLVMFQRVGSATLEFYYAPGAKTEFDSSFVLVGERQDVPYGPKILTDLASTMFAQTDQALVRIPFMADNLESLKGLELRMQYDAAFVAYLNGVEVARRNVTTDGPIAAATSRLDRVALTAEKIDISEQAGLLHAGQNLLAVRLLNEHASDQDSILLPQLVGLIDPQPIIIDDSVELKTRVLDGVDWSAMVAAPFTVAAPASAADLRISEIHYHPAPPSPEEAAQGFDNADEFEFVELLNIGARSIDLTEVQLAQIGPPDAVQGVAFTFGTASNTVLAAGERLVVVENLDAFRARYGTEPRVAGEWAGGLSNGGETITLSASGQVIHQFAYDDRWYPTTDGGGPSLELRNPVGTPLGEWALATSWQPSFLTGGTPAAGPSSLPGDANRDGVFDSLDLLLVMQAAEFEDQIADNSSWEEGDWNGDGDFDTRDIVWAFIHNTYVGTPPSVAAHPLGRFAQASRPTDEASALSGRLGPFEPIDAVLSAWEAPDDSGIRKQPRRITS